MASLTVAGQRVHYVHRASRSAGLPPVVFIHGAGGSHQNWLFQVRDLPSTTTYAPDLPGHGRSEGAGQDTIPAYADWIVAFLDAARSDRAVLVGHSMGGAIALDVALRYPDRVAGLGLVATGARLRTAPLLLETIQQDADAAIRHISDTAFGPEIPEWMKQLGRRQMAATPPEVLYGDFVACDSFDLMGQLGRIMTPTCVICGTHDQMTPSKYSTYLRDQIAGAELVLVEAASHMVMVEKPVPVLSALSDLLDRLQSGLPGQRT